MKPAPGTSGIEDEENTRLQLLERLQQTLSVKAEKAAHYDNVLPICLSVHMNEFEA